jgi:hypothetical protein
MLWEISPREMALLYDHSNDKAARGADLDCVRGWWSGYFHRAAMGRRYPESPEKFLPSRAEERKAEEEKKRNWSLPALMDRFEKARAKARENGDTGRTADNTGRTEQH